MSFPRREKAVRRRKRKDPGHNSRRAGLSLAVSMLLLAVCASPESRAQAPGPVLDDDRVAPATAPVHFNLNFLPWRKESATRQTVESAFARTRPTRTTATVVAPRSASYLATGGSIPMRYAPVRSWPDRMAPEDETALSIVLAPDPDLAIRREQLVAEQAAGVPATPTVMPSDNGSVTTTASSAEAMIERSPQIVPRAMILGHGEVVLTTDLVLRSLQDIPTERGSVPEGFRPAVPQGRSFESFPAAVAP